MTRNFLHFDSPTPQTHVISRDDTGTPLSFVVGDLLGPFNLTGASLALFYFVKPDTFVKSDLTPDPDQVANKGRASGFWRTDETAAIPPGNFPCHMRVTFPSGKIRWCPERPLNTLVLADSLAHPQPIPVDP